MWSLSPGKGILPRPVAWKVMHVMVDRRSATLAALALGAAVLAATGSGCGARQAGVNQPHSLAEQQKMMRGGPIPPGALAAYLKSSGQANANPNAASQAAGAAYQSSGAKQKVGSP